jgi:hypothetical protein
MPYQIKLKSKEKKMKTLASSLIIVFLLAGVWVEAGEARDNPITVSQGSEVGNDTEGATNAFRGQMDGGSEGPSNTFYGTGAGTSTSGTGDTFIGVNAGHSNTTADFNTFIGYYSGQSNTTGYQNTFLGRASGSSNTTGYYNSFLGHGAGYLNTTGESNTFLGQSSGYSNSTGSSNTFLGRSAGYFNTEGNYNTFLGNVAGHSNTIGESNTFLGYASGNKNTSGYCNTFLGHGAGYLNTTGAFNTFIGLNAGYSNTTADLNTFLGYGAGYLNTTGGGNTFLGYEAGYNETGSNKLYIDHSCTSDPLIYGEFDYGIVNINGKLGIGTKTPGYPMEMVRTGTNSCIVVNRTDGAKNYINATAAFGNFGTVNNYPLRLVVNSLPKMTLNSDKSMSMASGATCTAGGVWTNASSIALKENVTSLNSDEAATTLQALNPVKYNYKAEKDENHVGFIAEEVPELVAMKDRKSLSPMDIVAVLTKVTQDQQKQLQEQQALTQKQLQEQQQINDNLTQKMQEQQQINEKMKMEIAKLKKTLSE